MSHKLKYQNENQTTCQFSAHKIGIEVLSNKTDKSSKTIQAVTEATLCSLLVSFTRVKDYMKDDKEYIFAVIFEIASRSMANPHDKTDMTSCLDTLKSLMEEQKDADVSIDVNCISNILKPKVSNGLLIYSQK